MIITSFAEFVKGQRLLELNASTYKHAAEIRGTVDPGAATKLLGHIDATKEVGHVHINGLKHDVKFFVDDRLSVLNLEPGEFKTHSRLGASLAPEGSHWLGGKDYSTAPGSPTKKCIIGTISKYQDDMEYVWVLNGTRVNKYLFTTRSIEGNIAEGDYIEIAKMEFRDPTTNARFHDMMVHLAAKPDFQPYDYFYAGTSLYHPNGKY